MRRQLFGRNAQPRAGNAGVVKVRFDGRILRIDPQAARKAADKGPLPETFELRDGVEGDMVAAMQYLVDIAVRIGRGVGVGGLPELLENEARLGGGTRSRTVGVPRQFGKNAPHGASLQGHDNFGTRFPAHAVDRPEVRIEQFLVEDVARRRQFQKVNHRIVFSWISSFVFSTRHNPGKPGSALVQRKRPKQLQK